VTLEFVNTIEGSTSGTAVSTGNSAAGGNAWQGLTVGTGNTITYDASPRTGLLSLKFTLGTTAASYVQWTPSQTGRYVLEFEFKISALSTGNLQIAQTRNSAGIQSLLLVNSAGGLLMQNAAGTTVAGSTSANGLVTANTWYRVAIAITPGTTTSNGRLEYAFYADPTDTVPAATWDSGATTNTGTTAVFIVRVGHPAGAAVAARNLWYDNVRAGGLSSGFFGPYTLDLGTSTTDVVSTYVSDLGAPAFLASTTAVTSVYAADVGARLGLTSATAALSTSTSAIIRDAPIASTTAAISATISALALLSPLTPGVTAAVSTYAAALVAQAGLASTTPVITTYVAGGIVRTTGLASTTAAVSTTSSAIGASDPLTSITPVVSTYSCGVASRLSLASRTDAVTTTTSAIGSQTPGGTSIASTTTAISTYSADIGARLGLAGVTTVVTTTASALGARLGLASRTDAVTTTGGGPLGARLGLVATTPVQSTYAAGTASRLGLASTTPVQSLYSGMITARYVVGGMTVTVVSGGSSDIGSANPSAFHDLDILRVVERPRLWLIGEDPRRATIIETVRRGDVHERLRSPIIIEQEREHSVKGQDMILKHGEQDYYRFSMTTSPVLVAPAHKVSFDEGVSWLDTEVDPDVAGYQRVLIRHAAYAGASPGTLVGAGTIKPRCRAITAPVDVWYPGPVLRVED
jgi:hypothetical protein